MAVLPDVTKQRPEKITWQWLPWKLMCSRCLEKYICFSQFLLYLLHQMKSIFGEYFVNNVQEKKLFIMSLESLE